MDQGVSKVRKRKTRTRQRQADRAQVRRASFHESPVVGLLIALTLWACTVVMSGTEIMAERRFSLQALLPFAGNAALLLAALLAAAVFMKVTRPTVLYSNAKVLMLSLISLISLASGKALFYMAGTTGLIPPETALFLTPLAIAPMLATLLVDRTTGVLTGVWTSLAMATIAHHSLALFVTGMVATAVAVQMTVQVRTRAKLFRTGLVIGVSEITCVFALTALRWHGPAFMPVIQQAAACLFSGFFAAVVVLLILPLFETVFRITTDITLLELSDLGHPLLQRLAMEAPGTYHHSLVVASLAQAAADEIGANSLLTRVSAYFHDIGKLTKPGFFSENLQMQSNPHDDLPPSMSTLVITAHVKEGLSLAMIHKLPDVILQAIREHHGTGLLSYFHHKAKSHMQLERDEQNGGQTNIAQVLPDESFRYPGPRPSSKETALLCLADAVEAASRSMEKTTPGHIESLVSEIIRARLDDGQMDACPLTLAEINRIKRSFVFTLTNMLHGRVPYPKDENRSKQQPRAAAPRPPEDQATGPVPVRTTAPVGRRGPVGGDLRRFDG